MCGLHTISVGDGGHDAVLGWLFVTDGGVVKEEVAGAAGVGNDD